MLTHPTYPTGAEVRAFLYSLGIAPTTNALEALAADIKASAAAADWERRTGWQPFLGGDTDEARYFDPPIESRYLLLGAGLLTLASLTFGAAPGGSGGTVMAQGQGYRLLPLNATARGLPAEIVEFLSGGYGQPTTWAMGGGFGVSPGGLSFGAGAVYGMAGSVEIVGQWGRQIALTDDVWQAVLQRAALLCLPELALMLTKGVVEWSRAGVSEKRDPSPLKAHGDAWGALYEGSVALYRRPVMY